MSLRTKLLITVVVLVIFATVGVYPIAAAYFGLPAPKALQDKLLRLGLDLKGGVHLVLRVQTDDALRVETEGEMERLREALHTANINTGNIALVGPTQFKVEGVSPEQDQAFRQASADIEVNLE